MFLSQFAFGPFLSAYKAFKKRNLAFKKLIYALAPLYKGQGRIETKASCYDVPKELFWAPRVLLGAKKAAAGRSIHPGKCPWSSKNACGRVT
jgi:hypothetical protein